MERNRAHHPAEDNSRSPCLGGVVRIRICQVSLFSEMYIVPHELQVLEPAETLNKVREL